MGRRFVSYLRVLDEQAGDRWITTPAARAVGLRLPLPQDWPMRP
jgi:hypothetical protein